MANGSSFVSKTAYSEQMSAIEISSQYESVQGLARRMRADRVAVEHIAGRKGAYARKGIAPKAVRIEPQAK